MPRKSPEVLLRVEPVSSMEFAPFYDRGFGIVRSKRPIGDLVMTPGSPDSRSDLNPDVVNRSAVTDHPRTIIEAIKPWRQ